MYKVAFETLKQNENHTKKKNVSLVNKRLAKLEWIKGKE